MTLYGKTNTNAGTGVVSFDAIRSRIFGDEKPSAEHHELTVIEETDQGTYRVRDTHGREWTLIDYEDEAELFPN
jgi:hypothetical protein